MQTPESLKRRNELVLKNLPLATWYARRYAGLGIEHEELISAARLGLIRASERFDESKGFKFSVLAVPCMKSAIRDLLTKEIPQMKIASLDAMHGFADDEDAECALIEQLPSSDQDIDKQAETSEFWRAFRNSLKILDELEREAICLYYGLRDGVCISVKEVSKKIGRTEAQCGNLIQKAIIKLRRTVWLLPWSKPKAHNEVAQDGEIGFLDSQKQRHAAVLTLLRSMGYNLDEEPSFS